MSCCRLKGMPISENVTCHMLMVICMPSALSICLNCEVIADCYFDAQKIIYWEWW